MIVAVAGTPNGACARHGISPELTTRRTIRAFGDRAGLAPLTHTPSPMRFPNQILDRPAEERCFLLIPVGSPAADATVPANDRKRLDEVLVWRFGRRRRGSVDDS